MRFKAVLVLASVCVSSFGVNLGTKLINGTPVSDPAFDEVVSISNGGAGCTATIVGTHTIITAAHCGSTGTTSEFEFDGVSYSAKMTRSPLYPKKDHDISVGITKDEIVGAVPLTIGGAATKGDKILLMGFGCTAPPGTGGNDGVLRSGESEIISFNGYDMVSRTPGGAALCYGDSGGPAFSADASGKVVLLGINSKGNISDTNYNTRLDMKESTTFLSDFAKKNSVEICGINATCP